MMNMECEESGPFKGWELRKGKEGSYETARMACVCQLSINITCHVLLT